MAHVLHTPVLCGAQAFADPTTSTFASRPACEALFSLAPALPTPLHPKCRRATLRFVPTPFSPVTQGVKQDSMHIPNFVPAVWQTQPESASAPQTRAEPSPLIKKIKVPLVERAKTADVIRRQSREHGRNLCGLAGAKGTLHS